MTLTEVKAPQGLCNRNESHKATNRCPLCLMDSDNHFILDKIKRTDTIEYGRKMSVDDSYE